MILIFNLARFENHRTHNQRFSALIENFQTSLCGFCLISLFFFSFYRVTATHFRQNKNSLFQKKGYFNSNVCTLFHMLPIWTFWILKKWMLKGKLENNFKKVDLRSPPFNIWDWCMKTLQIITEILWHRPECSHKRNTNLVLCMILCFHINRAFAFLAHLKGVWLTPFCFNKLTQAINMILKKKKLCSH